MAQPNNCSAYCELPEHLKEDILALLPLDCICKFRSVSKQWNALLSSTKFITNKWAEAPPNRNPWLVVGRDLESRIATYCFFTQTWKETSCISFYFLLQKYVTETRAWNARISCKGSAAGLFLVNICYLSSGFEVLNVCNPITRTSLTLRPNTSIWCTPIITGIVAGESDSPQTYKVVTVSNLIDQITVEVYDSSHKSWRIAGHLPRDLGLLGTAMVFCQGSFYCLTAKPGGPSIMGFSMGEGTFIFESLPPELLGRCKYKINPQLLSCGSRILVAGGIIKDRGKLLQEVIIWEFDKVKMNSSFPTSSRWKEISRMPSSMCEGLNSNWHYFHRPFECIGVGDSVCFVFSRGMGVMEVLAYSLSEKTWSALPNYYLDQDTVAPRRVGYGLISSFQPTAFQPRPDMKIW